MYAQFEGKRIIFVFGSNLAGRHGLGAALHARTYYGAIYGRGRGIQNNSYAIPTKGYDLGKRLTLEEIKGFVDEFLQFAMAYEMADQNVVFRITAIGTGEAKYSHEEIAPMFRSVSANCYLPSEWQSILRRLGVELDPSRYIRR